MMDRPDVMLRYQALEAARELLRTDAHSDDLLAEALRIEAYMLGVAPQEDGKDVASAVHEQPFTAAEPFYTSASGEMLTIEDGAAPIGTLQEKPARKPRGPNKPKAAKKASGKKRGRPARAEALAEKDLPIANANGTGEHTPAPITGDEPQPIAA